ncbi:MAG: alpha-2-macroglobulin family protein [bacterium]
MTDTKGEANISADALPDNLTTWVIESLVNTKDTKVGIATNTIQTALPLMISPNLPNIFSINDTVVLHPVIFNKTDKEQNVSLSIS